MKLTFGCIKCGRNQKAIGGEKFCPWLSDAKEDFEPDYISVAYGTNH